MNELPNVIGPPETFELILAKVSHADWCSYAFVQQISCHGRNQHLHPMCDSSKSCAVTDSWTVIVSASGIGFTRVHSHADPKRRL